MDRRQFLNLATMLAIGSMSRGRAAFAVTDPMLTKWDVYLSEGMDAVAFLGALAGQPMYLAEYTEEAAAFGPRLPKPISADLAKLPGEAEKSEFGLLWPNLLNLLSGADLTSIDDVIRATASPEAAVLPSFRASSYWDEPSWRWFLTVADRLQAVFTAMRDGAFAAFRTDLLKQHDFVKKTDQMRAAIARYDVIRAVTKLTGRQYQPTIQIVSLYFVKPHGVKIQGQRFLTSPDYDPTAQVRIAAHELLHPPVPMEGPVAKAALAILAKDAVMNRIVTQHNRDFGYNSLDGYFNEDLCQAVDQLVIEGFGVAHNPADRWRAADDGMHVLAAAFYGMLREDQWQLTGGSLEQWLSSAIKRGRLTPANLHSTAARVLERPPDHLWPVPARSS